MQKKIIYFLLLLSLIPALVFAGSKGRIKGKITDLQTGEPLIGANVQVVGTSFGGTSDANGDFVINNLDPGAYNLRASFIGYQSISVNNVRVSSDLTAEQSFQLPADGITVSTITVTAVKPLVNKDNTNAIRTTTSEDIESIPVRGVANIYALSAGVTVKDGVVHMRGGRYDEVGYYLEGVTVTDPVSGGNAVRVSQDAVEEIQVQAGGYTAEFGGANSGIIRQELKSGTSNFKGSVEYITDNIGFKSQNNIFDGKKTLGTYTYGYDELSAVLSGPVMDKIKFFGNVDYVYNRDKNPQPFPGINMGILGDKNTGDTINFVYPGGPVKGRQSKNLSYIGTLSFDLSPVMVRLSGSFTNTKEDNFGSPIANMFNSRIGVSDYNNGVFNAKITHVLSPSLFYEISGGYFFRNNQNYDPYLKDNYWAYGDSVANADAGVVWQRSAKDLATSNRHGRYAQPAPKNVMGFQFTSDGAIPCSYSKYDRSSMTFAGNLSWLVNKTHSIKLGGEFSSYVIRNFSGFTASGLASSLDKAIESTPNANVDSLKQSIMINNAGVNNYGYDVLGNKTDAGFDAPHKPVFASAYVQDKIEYQDLVLNLGLRFDYINTDNKMLVNPAHPDDGINADNGQIKPEGWTNVPTTTYLSPRLGFSFPVTEGTMFHAQYGKFIQQTRLADEYLGYYRLGYQLKTGYFFGSPAGNYLKPTRTTQYELGFTQQITDFMSVDITGYYKDIKDQSVFYQQHTDKTSAFSSYYTLANGDFSSTKGVELTFTMRRYERLAINGMVAFQDAQGTGSYSNSNRGIVGAPLDGVTIFTPKYISPLEFNNAVRANLNLDYRFGDDDGPAFLHNFGVSILANYNSGHPFTMGTGPGSLESDARNRRPVEPLGASVTPSYFQVDMRIDKGFTLYDKLSATIYVEVINLLDKLNVNNVFLRTGSPNDDGFISNPDLSSQLHNTYGPQYDAFYKAINIDYYEAFYNASFLQTTPYMYGAPRQIRLGIRLEY